MSYRISFFNQKGGTGKSTLALQVAASIADTEAKVCIIDLDSQRSCLSYHQNCNKNTFDVFKVESEIVGKDYDVIIYDHSPERSPENLPHVSADAVIVPFQASGLDYLSTLTALDALEKRGQPLIKVVNRFVKNREISKDFLKEIDVDYIVQERSIYSRSITQHTTIYSLTGMSRFAYGVSDARKEIDALVEKIIEKIQTN